MAKKPIPRSVTWAALAVGVAAGLVLSSMASGPDPLTREQAMYCEMVEINKQDPELGWPDYNHTYNKECPNAR